MFAKVEITGTLEVLTGMHIGGSSAFAAIGAVDSPIVRDTLSDMPMIPGSSLKGKLRTLLAQKYNAGISRSYDDDVQLLAEAMQLLEFDYLGGHGSRGYGKVKISDIQLRPVVGEVSDALLEQCRAAFKGV